MCPITEDHCWAAHVPRSETDAQKEGFVLNQRRTGPKLWAASLPAMRGGEAFCRYTDLTY